MQLKLTRKKDLAQAPTEAKAMRLKMDGDLCCESLRLSTQSTLTKLFRFPSAGGGALINGLTGRHPSLKGQRILICRLEVTN